MLSYFFHDSTGRYLFLAFFKTSVLLWCFYISGITGVLQIQQIQVPHLVLSGHDVTLECMYKDILMSTNSSDIRVINPTSSLYSLKWYKGSWEFYRHVPRETPSSKVFLWSEFKIDSDDSQPGKVILRNVSIDAKGSYKCEVSSEGTFHTDVAEANMTVIDVQNETMLLYQDPDQQEVWPGYHLRWMCSFGFSRPPTHFSWFVNGELVEETHGLLEKNHTSTNHQNQHSESFLELVISKEHFKDNRLRITCVAQIGTVFKRTKEVHIRQGTSNLSAASHRSPFAVVGSQSRISGLHSTIDQTSDTLKSNAKSHSKAAQFPLFFGVTVFLWKLDSVLCGG